ncbi:MAG TPA: ABC transporter ATP-binding protein [Acidimicrobiia bacterium]|nr:ABC transporter ATP-binding protein [Acidimicrobiia bacterium]
MPLLELEDITKTFGGLPAVDGVDLGADEGEILAIVGPNGAGKSTLLKMIVGLEDPTRGRIRFDGEDITHDLPHRVRRKGIAMVEQTPRSFPHMSVLENATLGAMFGAGTGRRDEDEALDIGEEMLSQVGLADRRHHQVGSLNLHEQRFLALARALSGHPRLLLLDEVMAGLNETELASSIEMVRTIRERFGLTVVWVEHVMQAVMQLAERVVVLDFGRVLAQGPADVVMRHDAVIEAYLGTAGTG